MVFPKVFHILFISPDSKLLQHFTLSHAKIFRNGRVTSLPTAMACKAVYGTLSRGLLEATEVSSMRGKPLPFSNKNRSSSYISFHFPMSKKSSSLKLRIF